MPQLARTAGWNRFFSLLSLRSFIFLAVNVTVQAWILMMLGKEIFVMDAFAGKVYLCDFGAHITDCPGDPHCTGPSGTSYTPARMYNFAAWQTRTFFRDSLISIF